MKNIVALLFLFLLCLGVQAQPIQRNYFTTNVNPQLNITNGNLISTNIYVSNVFATNITVNNITNLNTFNGRTTITTNLYVTNAFISYLTNNTFISTNAYISNAYITNLFVDNIVTNNFTTNLTVNNLTVNTNAYITNLFATTTISTNNTFNFITNDILYSTNIYTTNLTANYITNLQDITTNLYVSNAFFTNLTVEFITNDFLFVTNLYNSNAFITNLTANYITNNTSYTTNLISSNIYTTNIFVMEASWFTNRWVGPTNDVNFDATYQNFVASTDMEITGFQNSIATNANTSVLLLDPGGATRTLYFPATWTNFTSDGNNAYVIPKTNTAIVTLFQYGNLYTNVVFRLFGPGTSPSQVWTNDNGVVHTVPASTPVSVGGITANNALGIGGTLTDTDSDNFASFTYHVSGTDVDPYGFVFNLTDSGLLLNTNVGTIGLLFESNVRSDGVGVLWGGDDHGNPDASGHIGLMAANVGIGAGEQAGVVGYSKTTASSQYSTVGTVIPNTDNQTNVGVFGIAATGGHPGKFSAGRFQLFSTAGTHPFPMSAALVADSGDVALPEQKWATNNGTVTATMSGGTLTAHGVVDDVFAANGVVTNDSTGLLHTTPTLPSTLLPTDLAYTDKNNAFTTASSNYVAMTVTTSTNLLWSVDFSVPEGLLSTNAAFTFAAPVGVDTTLKTVQWTLVNVTNTTAAAVLITSPANCHTVGTAYVTNLTCVWFQVYASKFTNAFYIPVF